MYKLLYKPAHFGEMKKAPFIIRVGVAGIQWGLPGQAYNTALPEQRWLLRMVLNVHQRGLSLH